MFYFSSRNVMIVLSLSILISCGKIEPNESFHREVTDPDGVVAYENGTYPAEWTGLLPRLHLEEVARIGKVNGPDEQIISSAYLRYGVSPDGGVGYWERQPSELRSYDSNGSFRFRAGRSGSGPGELRFALNFIHIDGVGWMAAGVSNRLVLYDDTGGLLYTITAPDLPGRILNTLTAHLNGRLWYFSNSAMSMDRAQTYLIRADWKTASGDTVMSALQTEMVVKGDAGLILRYPQNLAMDASGRAWVNTTFDYQIDVFGNTAGDHWRVRRTFEPIPDPNYGMGADESRWIGAVLDNKRIYSRANKFYPAIQQMQWVDNRELWVFTSVPVDSTHVQVDVFTADGVYVRAFAAEERLGGAHFKQGHVWILTSDEEEAPVLIRYRYEVENSGK